MKKRLPASSFWLFFAVTLVYLANGRPIGSGDTLPARYLPFSLLRAHTFDLGAFPFLYGEEAAQTYPVLDGIPYFLRYRDGRYLSAYAPGPAIIALPVYALPVLLGVGPASPGYHTSKNWRPRSSRRSRSSSSTGRSERLSVRDGP